MIKKIDQTVIRGLDPTLGYAYSHEDDLPLLENEKYENGLIYIGNKETAKVKIGILGGSTSDISLSGSWLRPMYKLLNDENICIISGAMSGYSTSQELLKLIRDIIPSKPDIVLSLNGINDMNFTQCASPKHPLIHSYQVKLGNFLVKKYGTNSNTSHFFNKYSSKTTKPMGMNSNMDIGNLILGFENSIESFESWYRNIKMAKALCKEFDIKYLSFLQPTFGVGKYEFNKKEETIYKEYLKEINPLYDKSLHKFYKNARLIVKMNSDFMIDLVDIFQDYSEFYYDIRHPNKKGNEILAREITKIIKEKKYI
ncbi:MAG: hypothetical protein WA916_04025 [Arcobacter sp.]|uniref:hypothetical protein n=1 Tax=Arcobacter sp. TaxID=1872629 RepID=UPI003C712E6D